MLWDQMFEHSAVLINKLKRESNFNELISEKALFKYYNAIIYEQLRLTTAMRVNSKCKF